MRGLVVSVRTSIEKVAEIRTGLSRRRINWLVKAAACALVAMVCFPSISISQEISTPVGGPDSPSSIDGADDKPLKSEASGAPEKSTGGLKANPSEAAPGSQFFNLGMAELKRREFIKAIDLFSKAIVAAPQFAAAFAERGHAHIGAGHHELAIADLTKALSLYGNDPTSTERARLIANRGLAYLSQSKHEPAMADFDRAIALDPKLAFAYANRGLSEMQRKQLEPALRDVGKAIELRPTYEFAYLLRGLLQIERKKFSEAASDFTKVLATAPENRGAILGLRQALLAGKDSEEPAKIRLVKSADSGCEPNCAEWIAIDGKIETGSAETLKDVLKTTKRRVPIFVDSGGGSVTDAMEMGRLIRAQGLDVVVTRTATVACARDDVACRRRSENGRVLGRPAAAGAICASSCGFLLAAGARRYAGASTLVGVHQITSFQTYQRVFRQYEVRREVRDGKVVEVDRRVVSETRGAKRTIQTATKDETYVRIRKYFADMGIGETIMPLLIGAPAKGMHWLTAAELKTTSLVTDVGHAELALARAGVPRAIMQDDTGAETKAEKVTVTVPAAPAADVPADDVALTRAIQAQLVRIGCTPGAEDGKWGQGVRRALERVNALTGQSLKIGAPAAETLLVLKARSGATCPSQNAVRG